MDSDSQGIQHELSRFTVPNSSDGDFLVNHSNTPATCAVCRKILLPDDEATGELEDSMMCGDCKFLLFEDLRSPIQDSRRRRPPRGRRTRYSSSESIENFLSHFSHVVNVIRPPSTVSGHEDQPVEADAAARSLQYPSSRATSSGSRRWRRVLSDTESDGFDNLDSLYGESESNISYGGYRPFNGESDAISFSAYGGDSDASVDGNSLLDNEIFVQPDYGNNLNSDTDIDPMHARLSQWNSNDEDSDDEGDEDDAESEEADTEENAVESSEAEVHSQTFFPSEPREGRIFLRSSRLHSDEVVWDVLSSRFTEGREIYVTNMPPYLVEQESWPYVGNSEDYLDSRGFEELLERLAETDTSRRGAPPAAVSIVNSLPLLIINKEHEKHDDLVCAICKDVLSIGTEVNQLPCLHLYHPSCILPWLTARNSCPLCRYELPTDDKEYEEGKMRTVRQIQQQDTSDDSSSDTTDGTEAEDTCEIIPESREPINEAPVPGSSNREAGRGRWFFLAAAPIVGLVGMALVLWLRNPVTDRRGHGHTQVNNSSSTPLNYRENRSRRWWSLF